MTTTRKTFLICAFLGATLFTGCAPRRAQTSPPEPNLCSLDGGRWCTPCATCPQGDSGWLCCEGNACIPNVAQADCLGIWGWCEDYSKIDVCTEDGACITTAECHDNE